MYGLMRRMGLEEDLSAESVSELYGGTYYQVEGNGPVILLVHGLGQDSRLWDDVAEHLRDDHRVIRFDLLGHGLSAKPPGPYTLASYLRQFEIIERRTGFERIHLVGHSAGAFVALRYALSASEHVLSATFLHPFARLPRAGAEDLVSTRSSDRVAAMRKRCDPNILDSSEKIFKEFWQELSDQDLSLSVPAKIIVGANDPSYHGPVGHDLNRKIPGSSIHSLPKIGVLSPFENANNVAELIREQVLGR